MSDCLQLEESVFAFQLGDIWGDPEVQNIMKLIERVAETVPRNVKRFCVIVEAVDLDEDSLDEVSEEINWERFFTSLSHCDTIKLSICPWEGADLRWYSQWCDRILRVGNNFAAQGKC